MARQWTKAQEAAMNTRDRLLLVSAAAGSGKTATLTERIIRRLTDRENPAELSRLLVVTFTRAAAAELKTRIAEALSEAIAADPGSRHLQKQLLGISSAHICTIDAFCMDAVRADFARLGLPAGFRIADNAELIPLSDHVMDELIGQFYKKYAQPSEDGASLFSMLDGNPFADLCDALSKERSDEDLTGTLRGLYNTLLNYPAGLERLKQQADALRTQAEGEILQSDAARAVAAWKQEFALSVKTFYDEALAMIASDPASLKAIGKPFAADADFAARFMAADTYEGIRELLAAKPSTRASGKNLPDAFGVLLEKRTFYNDAFRETFRKELFADSAEEIRRDMRRTAVMCDVLYDFLTAYDTRMAAEKRQRGICDFTDNRRNLLKLLTEPDGSPSPFADELRARYDEVYIDEYQDVDEVQDSIFRLVGGGHRFMVGDIKQSIYGFRGADPGVFAAYRKRLPLLDPASPDAVPKEDGGCLFMSENFRCDQPVISFTNMLCGHLFRACPDSIGYQAGDDLGFAKSMPDGAESHKVQIDVLVKEPKSKDDPAPDERSDEDDQSSAEIELTHAANTIASLLGSGARLDSGELIRPEDIAILLRTNTHVKTAITALNRLGIQAGCAEMDAKWSGQDLLTGPDMTYLVNLLRVFDNPDSDGPLSEVLRAPYPGFSPENLMLIRSVCGGSLYDGVLACASGLGGDADLSARCAELTAWLEGYRADCMTLPADGILRLMRQDKRVAGRRTKAFLYLYEAARTSRTGSFTGVYDFLRYFEKRIADSKNAMSEGKQRREGYVNVMTIHASKGLEFPVVFLSLCGNGFRKPSGDLIFEKHAGLSMKLFDRENGCRYTPSLVHFAALEKELREREDEMRVLYVALTRARERLYVTGVCGQNRPIPFRPEDRFAALSGDSYLSWLLSVWSSHPEAGQAAELHLIPLSSIEQADPLTVSAGAAPSDAGGETADYYRRLLLSAPSVTAEDALLRRIPTKVPASRMTDKLLDECTFFSSDLSVGDEGKLPTDEQGFGSCEVQSAESLDRAIRLMESAGPDEFEALLRENAKPTAAEKGTAAHAFLQYCAYDKVLSGGVEAEMARLVSEGYLSARTAAIADREMLSSFFGSRFFGLVCEAASVRREFRFARFVPLRELTDNDALKQVVGDRTLYVQGSVDLMLTMPDGSLILCDYKTDRVTRAERDDPSLLRARLTERHGAQLKQYAAAVRAVFGREPDRVCIFSLPLGEAVDIML